jgi:hypothetical protein
MVTLQETTLCSNICQLSILLFRFSAHLFLCLRTPLILYIIGQEWPPRRGCDQLEGNYDYLH